MVKRAFCLLLFLAALPGAACASPRAASLVHSFAALCTAGPLDFKRLDAKATAMKLKVEKEVNRPADASGHFVHSKSWNVTGKTGEYELTAGEAMGRRGHVLGCGLRAPDVDGNDLKAELVKTEKLGDPRNEIISPDKSRRVTMWDYGDEGEGMQLMLTDSTPKAKPGIYLTLMQSDAAKARGQ